MILTGLSPFFCPSDLMFYVFLFIHVFFIHVLLVNVMSCKIGFHCYIMDFITVSACEIESDRLVNAENLGRRSWMNNLIESRKSVIVLVVDQLITLNRSLVFT